MSDLSDFLDIIYKNSNIHICIHDISGLLSCEKLRLNFEDKTHHTDYCNCAKGTPKGYKLCIKCKNLANAKAIQTKKPFKGYCPFGLFEAAAPVVFENNVLCIVYVGNIITNKNLHNTFLRKSCNITGNNPHTLQIAAKSCEYLSDSDYAEKTAGIVANYILLTAKENGYLSFIKKKTCSWVISEICEYTENNYFKNLTLKNISKLYFMNEKYLGRLFKKETGESFRHYLNNIRLKEAVKLLQTTDLPVLEIALDCGYSNVTYFNKLCLESTNTTPTEIRKKHTQP